VAEQLHTLVVLVSSSDAAVHFAIAVLHSVNNTTAGHLDGDVFAMGYAITDCPEAMVFVFGNLAISYPGLYTIRVDIYEITNEGATLTCQIETDTISVFNSQALRCDSS
jgi:hypothetical protein